MTTIHGFLEIRKYRSQIRNHWASLIRIDDLVEPNNEIFAYIFGIGKTSDSQPLAESRGLPSYESYQLNSDSDKELSITWKEYKKYGNTAHSLTFVTYRELAESGAKRLDLSTGWKSLFAMMDDLCLMNMPEDIRLVVWFDS